MKNCAPFFTSLRHAAMGSLAFISVLAPAWADQTVLYCETFGNDKGVDVTLSEINTDWRGYRGRNAKDITEDTRTASSKVISSNPGFPRNVPNDGTPEPSLSEDKGFAFQSFNPGFFGTTGFEIDPSKYSTLSFNWQAANSDAEDGFRVAVRIDDAWYASEELFSTPACGIEGLAQNAMNFVFTTQALKWRHLDFIPDEMLAVGETCTMDLPRSKITGFGLVFEGGGGNKRFDTFSVLVTPR